MDNLIRMANQIGHFFDAMPDRPEALEQLAQHLRRFWERRMRERLLAFVDDEGGAGLHPMVLEALVLHRGLFG
ncbi:formate dehydrogenase subunit delta [Pseudaquabacterium terrae]